jgi:hypothetical protein
MMRAWIGLALLSGSWLLGLGYYHPPHWPAWTVAIVLGTVLLVSKPTRVPSRRELGIALAMLLPAVWLMPWPYRAAPLLFVVGIGLQWATVERRWLKPLGWGAVKAGTLLLVQSLALLAYSVETARCHDLPRPLPRLLGWIASLMGIDAAVHGHTLTMHSRREIGETATVHYLAASWGLLLDPATLCFFVGGLVLLALLAWNRLPQGARWSSWLRAVRVFALVLLAWLPLRFALLVSLYLHRVLRAAPTVRLTAMNQFFSPWVCLALLLGPVLLVWWFVRSSGIVRPGQGDEGSERPRRGRTAAAASSRQASSEEGSTSPGRLDRWRYPAALALTACGMATIAFIVQWDPVGSPKGGRVMVVERHSTWEPSDEPYDKDHFGHDPSYAYTRAYDYCDQYFEMSRLQESDPINHQKLSQCDVLIVKIPTDWFLDDEVKAITQFVEDGGGLLLVGDHTNVFNSTTYLNPIARQFGFRLRHDLLFRIGSPYVQELKPPTVPHPIVQHLPPMHYAVSCSVDPGASRGRAVVRSTGLWSLYPDYHQDNYHPHAEYRAEMGYGAFIQLWATRHGRGRVAAYTDSTIFSNFCTFQPGKAELLLGMLQWLNRSSPLDDSAVGMTVFGVSLIVALALLAAGLALAVRTGAGWLVLFASGMLGLTAGSIAVVGAHRVAMPVLEPLEPMTRVVVDRTVSDAPLSLGSETQGDGQGYGLLEQWISRLGCYTVRARGDEAFTGDALVVICPTRSVPNDFRQGLVDYVAGGGRLLLIDSPDSTGSTSNSLLWEFGITVSHASSRPGRLKLSDDWPGLQVDGACEILGGEPFMWVDEMAVATRVPHGNGWVIAAGFGSSLNDTSMGGHWMLSPDMGVTERSQLEPDLVTRYDLLFALLEALLADRPVAAPTGQAPNTAKPAASEPGAEP